jgi:asparagine synthase (glutamine-hydrolysing)
MSGVFGVVARQTLADPLVRRMAHQLVRQPWQVAELSLAPGRTWAVGRTGIGVFNRAPQPVWSEDGRLELVLAGELYAVDGEPAELCGADSAARELAAYARHGTAFARHLNGAFVCALIDHDRQRLVIANDRFGLYPLYYSAQDGRFLFAPEVKAVAGAAGFRKVLDLTAVAQYVRLQRLLGTRTFFEQVQLLPTASVLTVDLKTVASEVHGYWSFAEIGFAPRIGFDEAAEEAGRLFRRAIERRSGGGHRIGVLLSGGYDSRLIAGTLPARPLATLTYGAPGCRDVRYAERIARAVGSQHHWVPFEDGRWVLEYIDAHLTLTEGFHSWIHAHGISAMDTARRVMDVNVSGWDGTVMGDTQPEQHDRFETDNERLFIANCFDYYTLGDTWPGLTEAEERLVYAPAMRPVLVGRAFDTFVDELRSFIGLRPDVRLDYFYLYNSCFRLTHNMHAIYREHLDVRFPFFDQDLVAFMYSLPNRLRGHKTLYRAVLDREVPALTRIPYDADEQLPTTRAWARRAHALAAKVERRWDRLRGRRPAPTLYADYEHYLRHELRAWAEGILFDPRTAARGLFDPAMLRSLMDRHLSGRELHTIGKIAPLITLELMLRRFFD